MNDNQKKNGLKWQAIVSIVTMVGIIFSLIFSMYFGIVLPRKNQNIKTKNVINGVISELNHNIQILDFEKDSERLQQLTQEMGSGMLPNGENILLNNNFYFFYRNDFWLSNKAYLAEYSPEYFRMFYHYYSITDSTFEISKILKDHEFAIYSYHVYGNENYKEEVLFAYHLVSVLLSKIRESSDFHKHEIMKLSDDISNYEIRDYLANIPF